MAEVGSLSARADMAKFFVKRVFTIFATNASFSRVIANSTQYNMQNILQGLSERMAKVKRFLWALNFTKS